MRLFIKQSIYYLTDDPENEAGAQAGRARCTRLSHAGHLLLSRRALWAEQADVWLSGMRKQDGVPFTLSQCEAMKCNSVKGWALELW